MTTTNTHRSVVLIPGHWLGAWAWDEVVEYLEADHTHVFAMTLPGLDGDDAARPLKTVGDQAGAIRGVIAWRGDQPVVVVAHGGADTPVSLGPDRHPELTVRVVWADSGPAADGTAFAPELSAEREELPLPLFEDLGRRASLVGLGAETLERFRKKTVPEPGPVARQSVELRNDDRH